MAQRQQQQRGLKGFYVGLAAVAVVGVGLLLWARGSGGTALTLETVAPVSLGGSGFQGYVLGSDTAPVTIIEYADFQCPACAQFAVLTGPDVKRRLVETGRARWIFRDFPLTNIHPNAVPAHHAAACASDQNRFWEMHDMLFFRHGDWANESRPQRKFTTYAEALGLDMAAYDACMDEGRHLSRIAATRQQGIDQGVSSTPTFIIGSQRASGNMLFDQVEALVEQAAARQ